MQNTKNRLAPSYSSQTIKLAKKLAIEYTNIQRKEKDPKTKTINIGRRIRFEMALVSSVLDDLRRPNEL